MSSYVGNYGELWEDQLKRRLEGVPLPNYVIPTPGPLYMRPAEVKNTHRARNDMASPDVLSTVGLATK